VRIGAHERVRERDAVPLLDHACEELEVHLVDDPGVRRDDLEVVECPLPPAQEGIALSVSFELELGVPKDRESCRVLVHLDGVVDDELDRKLRVDPVRVAAEIPHRVAHRSEVDDGRHAGEVLQQHAAGSEGDLLGGLGARDPAGYRLDVRFRDRDAVLVPQDVLEQDAERVRKPQHVEPALERLDAEDLERAAADVELRPGSEAIRVGHSSIESGVRRVRRPMPRSATGLREQAGGARAR
jgi:hypothetical protein